MQPTDMRVDGIIVSLDGNKANVRITQNSACVSCGENCSSCHRSVKHFVVANNNVGASVGEIVWVESPSALIYVLIILLYLLPLLVLPTAYILLDNIVGEGFAAVLALFATLIAFGAIYLTVGKSLISKHNYSIVRKI